MTRQTRLWLVILALAVLGLLCQGLFGRGLGRVYVRDTEKRFVEAEVPPPVGADAEEKPEVRWLSAEAASAAGINPDDPALPHAQWVMEREISPREYREAVAAGETDVHLSISRTVGLWLAAFFTLAIFSFLYRDNPFYKLAEATVVGVSAAYWMVVAFWDMIIPNLVAKLEPRAVLWAMPGYDGERDLIFVVPLVLGLMLLMRLSSRGGWIARWPLAFIIGTTAGLRMIAYLHGDFLAQIRATVLPLMVPDGGGFDFWASLDNVLLLVSVLCCLVYFFFSVEHRGAVGRVARAGIWVLMITFGAAFGYTVMGRIALLAIRLEFLFDDWLWIIDPAGRRAADAAAMLMGIG